MLQRLKTLAIAAVLNVSFVLGVGASFAYAQNTTNLNCGAQGNLTGTNCSPPTSADNTINKTIEQAIRIFQVVVGLISVFMVIFGGLKYITSGGESSGVTSAKNTILYAVIGRVVVALAEVIVQFVLNRVNAPSGQI